MFSLGEIPRRPSNPRPSHPKNNAFLGPRVVSSAQKWIAKHKNFEFYVFGKVYKKRYSKFLVEPL